MNVKKLTIGEIATVEKISGVSLSQLKDKSTPKAKLMIAMAYVIEKRRNPKVKVADIEDLPMPAVMEIVKSLKGGDPKSN